jgi:hypothetical protein
MQLSEQLREASVVLGEARRDGLATSVEKLAGANPSLDEQLARLRLAFSLDPGENLTVRFVEQLAAAGTETGLRDLQMLKTLAAAVLVARFGRPPGRRSLATLAPDSAAAIGARLLVRASHSAVHPDVGMWADYWTESLAMALREPRRPPSAPSFSPDIPEPQPDESATAHGQRVVQALQSEFTSFANDLVAWRSELDPAEIRAQGEQIDLLWWLAGGGAPAEPTALATWVAIGLDRHRRRVPGPPRADQLILRRMGSAAEKEVLMADVAAVISRPIPSAVADFCPVLSRNEDVLRDRALPAYAAAEWLFDELSLARLVEEPQ